MLKTLANVNLWTDLFSYLSLDIRVLRFPISLPVHGFANELMTQDLFFVYSQ